MSKPDILFVVAVKACEACGGKGSIPSDRDPSVLTGCRRCERSGYVQGAVSLDELRQALLGSCETPAQAKSLWERLKSPLL